MAENHIRTAPDGTPLQVFRWARADPRAAIVLVHGLGEHLGRYAHIGPAFVAAGFDVRGADTRGFGASGGPRAYADSFETLLDDLAVDVAAASALGVPVVLIGHSIGGLQALLYATSDRPRPDLLVLSSPAIRNTLPAVQTAVVKALARVLPKMGIKNPVDVTQLSRDQSVGERYSADPLVLQRSTFGLGKAAFGALDQVPAALATLDVPTLVTHGAEDRIVAPRVSAALADLAVVERVVFPDFRHEPCNEDCGTHAVDTIVGWIGRQLA